jgi:hypothetical protein
MVMSDVPIPFGYKNSWLAIATMNQPAVIKALGLRGVRQCTWREGISHTYGENAMVFVPPAVAGWIFVVGGSLLPEAGDPDSNKPKLIPYLEGMSKTLGRVQYFATHRVVEYHAWVLAENGIVRRAFGYLGESGEVLLKIGNPTQEEVAAGWADDSDFPTEETVMNIAGKWSLNPQDFDSLPRDVVGPDACKLGKLPSSNDGA